MAAMTVEQLIAHLTTLPYDAVVIMSRDSEGNGYSPLETVATMVYVPNSTWSGEAYVGRVLTPELAREGYDEEDCYDGDDAQDAVCLWPTN